MIYWNDNAKAAVRAFADYIGESDKGERYLEHIAPKKTVADAVECCKGLWPNDDYDYLNFHYKEGWFCSDKGIFASLVCSREEFEVYVKEQEGEKWTHVYCGEKCMVVGNPDSFGRVVILTESDAYFLDKPESLKPIKPTISEAQAWRKAVLAGNMQHITDNYDVVKD